MAATVLAQQTYTTTLTSRTITLTTSATAGRRVFLVFMNSNGTATGVTDTAGNTWTKEVTATGVTSPIVPTDIWSTPQTTNLASGAVITVTNAGGSNAHIYVIDPGVDLGTRDDVDGAFGNSATAAVTSTTLGTNRWELGVVSYGAANTTAPTVSGWTQVGTVTNTASTRSIWLGEKTQAAAGSSALSATLPASNQWVALQTAYPYTVANPTGGTGAAQSLGLTNGSATGSRTGSGAAQSLGLTNAAGTGSRTGAGAAQTLTLTNGVGTGSSANPSGGTGSAQTLAIATGSATGARQGTGGAQTLGLVAGTATGFTPLTMSGGGESLNLPLTVGVAEGQGYRWVLNPPTEPYYFPLLERSKLIGVIPRGLALLRIGGQWVTDFSPTPAQVDAADRIYEGGRYHPLTEDQRAELIDAGLGDLVSMEAL